MHQPTYLQLAIRDSMHFWSVFMSRLPANNFSSAHRDIILVL